MGFLVNCYTVKVGKFPQINWYLVVKNPHFILKISDFIEFN